MGSCRLIHSLRITSELLLNSEQIIRVQPTNQRRLRVRLASDQPIGGEREESGRAGLGGDKEKLLQFESHKSANATRNKRVTRRQRHIKRVFTLNASSHMKKIYST